MGGSGQQPAKNEALSLTAYEDLNFANNHVSSEIGFSLVEPSDGTVVLVSTFNAAL